MITAKNSGKICATIIFGVLMICLWSGCTDQSDKDRDYPVMEDCGNLAEYIDTYLWQNLDVSDYQPKVKEIYEWLDLEDKRAVLIDVTIPLEQPRLGIVGLESGPNGRYKVNFTTFTDQNIQCEIIETESEEYFLIAGRNKDKAIRRIVSTQEEKAFNVEIPEKEQFIVAIPTEDARKLWEFDPNSWHFYNAAGVDITDTIEW